MSYIPDKKEPLAGVQAKLERAEKHIVDFRNQQKTFLESKPVSFTHILNEDTRHVDVTIDNIKPMPIELSLIMGDAIHNLRSALDLLVCQVFTRNSKSTDYDYIEFPIGMHLKSFLDKFEKHKGKLQLVGKPAIDILTKLEPYRGGKHHDLWVLHRLDIRDKHRLLIVVLPSINRWDREIKFTPLSPEAPNHGFLDSHGSIFFPNYQIPKVGDQIDRIDASYFPDYAVGNFRVNYTFSGDLAIDEEEIDRGKSAVDILDGLFITVQAVIKEFEPLFDFQR
jgi:hypothetical protein